MSAKMKTVERGGVDSVCLQPTKAKKKKYKSVGAEGLRVRSAC